MRTTEEPPASGNHDPVMALVEQRPDFAAMAPADESCIQATRINTFIYQSNGSSNSYLLVTDDSRIIINTGLDFEALTHKRLFDDACALPTSHILLTQGHVDHIGGINPFREPGTCVIAQARHHECRRDDQRIQSVRLSQAGIWFQPIFDRAQAVAARHPEIFALPPGEPDVLFEHRHDLYQGGLQLQLLATPGGETLDSCVVWLPEQRILFSGNLFGPLFPHFPNINTLRGDKYRYLEPYLESLRSVRALRPELLITGHFTPIEGWPLIEACLDRLEQAVTWVHDNTLNGMNAGQDIWQLMESVCLPAHLAVGQGYGKVSWAVRTIWESYMGWFKAQQSSELYAAPQTRARRTLVRLAGAGAVLQQARTALLEGDLALALQLAEALLEDAPRNQDALAFSLEVHERLLDGVCDHNFWESGWLMHQIDHLRSALDVGA